MKILQCLPHFSRSHGGGVSAVGYAISKALKERGHDVTVYTTDFKLDKESSNSLLGIKVFPFHIWLSFAGLWVAPGIVREARKKFKDFDIIHMHDYKDFQCIVLHHYAKKYGIPYIMDAHGSVPRHGKKINWLYDTAFGDRILRDTSRCIAETSMGAREYEERGVRPDRIIQLYPPFPVEDYCQLPPLGRFRKRFNIKEEHIILYLGRINRIKGLDFIVESFSELARYEKDAVLAIVGPDDGYKSTLESLMEKLDLSEKVLFTGYLGGVEKQEALVDASIMVQTSIYEQGLSYASLEAILCNTPTIVSKNTGAAEDILRMDGGYLVEYGNKDELKDTMQHILDNPTDAAAKTLKAKEYILANLSIEKRIEDYEKIYMECIEESEKGKVRKG